MLSLTCWLKQTKSSDMAIFHHHSHLSRLQEDLSIKLAKEAEDYKNLSSSGQSFRRDSITLNKLISAQLEFKASLLTGTAKGLLSPYAAYLRDRRVWERSLARSSRHSWMCVTDLSTGVNTQSIKPIIITPNQLDSVAKLFITSTMLARPGGRPSSHIHDTKPHDTIVLVPTLNLTLPCRLWGCSEPVQHERQRNGSLVAIASRAGEW